MEKSEEDVVISRRATYTIRVVILILLLQLPSAAWAQQPHATDYVWGLCNTGTFSSNDTFARNFNVVVASLTHQASLRLYASASSQAGSSNTSFAYGIFQCRGDLPLNDCSSCVSNALLVNRVCGSGKGARAQYQGCFIRYEAYTFAGQEDASLPVPPTCSSAQDSSSLYQRNLATALKNAASAAPKHALFGYNATSVGTGSNTAFALAQCLGDVSAQQCANCLSRVSDYKSVCSNSVSGQFYFNACFYIFNRTSFLFTPRVVSV